MTDTAGMIKILYNDCYGEFRFSAAFDAEYKRRTGKEPNTELRLLRLVGAESIRTDPVAIAIWQEKGSEWCSGEESCIEVQEIPAIFEHYWEIEDASGDETVRVLITEALADLLHEYMASGNHAALVDRYRKIQTAASRIHIYGTERRAVTPPLLKRQTLVNPDELGVGSSIGGYGYFSVG